MLIGKVSAIFMNPKIEFSFSKDASSEKIHITRAHLIVNEKTKFIPTYDSNIPLVCFIYNFFYISLALAQRHKKSFILRPVLLVIQSLVQVPRHLICFVLVYSLFKTKHLGGIEQGFEWLKKLALVLLFKYTTVKSQIVEQLVF